MSDRIRQCSGLYIRLRLFLFFGPVIFERVQVKKFRLAAAYGVAPREKWVWRKPRPGEIAQARLQR